MVPNFPSNLENKIIGIHNIYIYVCVCGDESFLKLKFFAPFNTFFRFSTSYALNLCNIPAHWTWLQKNFIFLYTSQFTVIPKNQKKVQSLRVHALKYIQMSQLQKETSKMDQHFFNNLNLTLRHVFPQFFQL